MDMFSKLLPNYSGQIGNMHFAPNRVIVVTLISVFLLVLLCIIYAIKLPHVEGQFSVKNGTLFYVENSLEHPVIALSGIQNEWIPLTASDLIEEPDYLNEYPLYNAFLEKQNTIFRHLSNDQVLLKKQGGEIFQVKVISKHWFALPLMFWVQIIAASLAIIIGAWLWSFRQDDRAAWQYFISAIFIAMCIYPAAIYSTRSLALPGQVFHLLSVLDHLGLYLFCAAMLSLNWLFPYPLGTENLPIYLYIFFALVWLANTLQILPDFDFSIRGMALLTLIMVICMVYMHWQRNRFKPQYLILIKWFSLATIAGPGLFLAMIFMPPLFGFEPVISQGFAFVAFLVIYLAMAIAVSRYKLFEFERWWSESLIWISFGLLLISMDLLIVYLLDLSYQQASWVALAITGWIYFPLRQLILKKILLINDQSIRTHFPYVVSVIAGSANQMQLMKGMEDCIRKIFDPMHIEYVNKSTNYVQLFNDGSRVLVPLPDQSKSIEMIYADKGKRLFNSYDQKTASALIDLFRHALIASKAKEEGATYERNRIRQDIHDSLGGYLLSIMHRKSDPQSALLARYAWNELRDILSALDERLSPLSVELLRWKSTLEKSVVSDKLIFEFIIDESVMDSHVELNGFQRLNLGQILREAVTNAYRHANPSLISAYFEYRDGRLSCTIKNDGAFAVPEKWVAGRGMQHIKNRAQQLKAEVSWAIEESGVLAMSLNVPLNSLSPVINASITNVKTITQVAT